MSPPTLHLHRRLRRSGASAGSAPAASGSRRRSRLLSLVLGGLAFLGAVEAPALLSAEEPPQLLIRTVVGGGTVPGEPGGDPLAVALSRPEGLAHGPDGAVYVADSLRHRVWKVLAGGPLTLVAGTGTPGFSGDGGPAREAELNAPEGLAVGPDGSLYIGDTVNHRVRRVGPDGTITTVAGSGDVGYEGDGGAATEARLTDPNDLAVGPDGSLYILDEQGSELRRVGPDGTITTLLLDVNPFGLAVAPDGTVYVSDGPNHRVWRRHPDGRVDAAAGTGSGGFSGDGGPAAQAQLNRPEGLAVGPDGSLYIADRDNHRVRRVGPDGTISTVVATGERGFGGDGGDALEARLDRPLRVAAGPAGAVLVNDLGNRRVRLVAGSHPGPDATTTTTSTTAPPPPTSPSTTTTAPPAFPGGTTTTTVEPPRPDPTPSSTVPPTTSPTTTSPAPEPPGQPPAPPSTPIPSSTVPDRATTTTTTGPAAPPTSAPGAGSPPAAGPSPGTSTPPPGAEPADPPSTPSTTTPPARSGTGPVDPPSTTSGHPPPTTAPDDGRARGGAPDREPVAPSPSPDPTATTSPLTPSTTEDREGSSDRSDGDRDDPVGTAPEGGRSGEDGRDGGQVAAAGADPAVSLHVPRAALYGLVAVSGVAALAGFGLWLALRYRSL